MVIKNVPFSFCSWQFNSTTEIRDVPPSTVIMDGAISVATYVPLSEMDYGTLLCWGKNQLGRQRRPCVFHVIPAGTNRNARNLIHFILMQMGAGTAAYQLEYQFLHDH